MDCLESVEGWVLSRSVYFLRQPGFLISSRSKTGGVSLSDNRTAHRLRTEFAPSRNSDRTGGAPLVCNGLPRSWTLRQCQEIVGRYAIISRFEILAAHVRRDDHIDVRAAPTHVVAIVAGLDF